jgi:hypothetical protein
MAGRALTIRSARIATFALHSPFPEPAVTVTLACFEPSAIRGPEQGLSIGLKDA